MISAITPIVASGTSNSAYMAVGSGWGQAQSGSGATGVGTKTGASSESEGTSVGSTQNTDASTGGGASGEKSGETSATGSELTQEEQREVVELQSRDREVRAHEQAHQSAGAGLTGPASYTYTTGPDGKRYAVGGEVSIDTSPERDNPSGTIQKMQRVIAAALAPADPSGQDRTVASQARSTMMEAQGELFQQQTGSTSSKTQTTRGNKIDAMA
jgi:hypothetical protein